jgi:hypothetical protein
VKKIIVIITGIFLLNNANAQSPFFELGIKGGANMTKISGKSFQNEYQLNYLLGAFADLNFSNHVGIQPELLFSQTSSTTSSSFDDIYKDISSQFLSNVHLHYLSIPVLLSVGGKLIRVQAGPQFSILLNSNENLLQNSESAFSTGDVSMVGGLQINLPFHLTAAARFVAGLNNINDINNSDKWRNQQIQLSVGLVL